MCPLHHVYYNAQNPMATIGEWMQHSFQFQGHKWLCIKLKAKNSGALEKFWRIIQLPTIHSTFIYTKMMFPIIATGKGKGEMGEKGRGIKLSANFRSQSESHVIMQCKKKNSSSTIEVFNNLYRVPNSTMWLIQEV